MSRGDRLLAALEAARARLEVARGRTDEAALFAALGETLAWLVGLDEVLGDNASNRSVAVYRSARLATGDDGFLLFGLKHARNKILHEVTITELSAPEAWSAPRVIMSGTTRLVTPVSRPVHVFRAPPLDGDPPGTTTEQKRKLDSYRDGLAGHEIQVPIDRAVRWMRTHL